VLGANICFSETGVPLRSLLITSPSASEGKSLTAANLAAAIAQLGVSVALVEADMRRPSLGRLFNVDSNSEGLSTALVQGGLDGMLNCTAVEGLSLLSSGEPPANPTRLLGSQNLYNLLRELVRRKEVVVIDSPPVLPAADAMLLARHVDGVLLVLRAGHTRWQAARQALLRLHQVGANVAGVALNGVSTRRGSYYGDYYYSSYSSSARNGGHSGHKPGGSGANNNGHHTKRSHPKSSRGLFSRLSRRKPKGKEDLPPLQLDDAVSPVPETPSSADGG